MHADLAHLLRTDPGRALDAATKIPPGLLWLEETPDPVALVTDPRAVVAVLSDRTGAYVKSPATLRWRHAVGDGTAASQLPPDHSPYYGSFGTLEALRNAKRRAIAPAFSSGAIAAHSPALRRHTHALVSRWRSGQTIDLYAAATELMAAVTVDCLFDRGAPPEIVRGVRKLRTSSVALDRQLRDARGCPDAAYFDRGFPPTAAADFDTELASRRRTIQQLVQVLCATPSPQGPRAACGLLELLASPCPGATAALTPEQRMMSVVGLFFAGYENSASVAAWTLWALACDSEAQERASWETVQQLSSADEAPRLEQLPFVRACVYEALRLYPPVWSIPRVAMRPGRLTGHTVPADSLLLVSPWVQHRHPAVWEEAERFRPERFAAGAVPEPGIYLPFGLGERACIGRRFAVMEVVCFVAFVLRAWRLSPSLAEDSPVPWFTVTQRPWPHVRVMVHSRRASQPAF